MIKIHSEGKNMTAKKPKFTLLRPENAEKHFNIGVSCFEEGSFSKAIESFKKVLQIDPEPFCYYNLGMAYNELEKYEKAIEAFKQAISLGYGCADIHYSLGAAYALEEDFDSAFKQLAVLRERDEGLAKKLFILINI